ncbi:MAG: YybH family protein [Gemmatimonadota bacterium]
MKLTILRLAALALLAASPTLAQAQVTEELDAYWAELSRTVAEGDFEGYAELYHPDAVLVSLGSNNSYPIAEALAGWKQGFDDTAAGRAEAGVDFRLTQRLHDETTAHETGIFRYVFTPEDGETTVAPVHFEALMVKKDGRWLMLMEYQKEMATEEEWEAAGGGGE